jgi:F0F1-type ATP synthase membrane subunit b/b'
MSTAKLRVRMIARIFAETGVKDLFVGVREMLREGYAPDEASNVRKMPIKARMGNKWADIDPGKWPERSGLTVQVGVGSGGKDHDLMVANQGIALAREIIGLQGGIEGPIIDGKNVYNWLSKWSSAAGIRAKGMYWTNPAEAEPKPPQAEQPDPEMQKAQAQMQLEQAKVQGQMQLAQAQAQTDAQLQAAKLQAQGLADKAKAEADYQLAMAKLNAEIEMKRYQTDQELALKREQLQAELDLKRELAAMEIEANAMTGDNVNVDSGLDLSGVYVGGEPG